MLVADFGVLFFMLALRAGDFPFDTLGDFALDDFGASASSVAKVSLMIIDRSRNRYRGVSCTTRNIHSLALAVKLNTNSR